jgi:DNA-binding response OmpR family regulator
MSSKVVLFWNEEPTNEQIITKFLKDNGFEVLIAENEIQCHKYLASRYIDLVLLDIERDDLTRLILTKKIRTISKHHRTPIISLTEKIMMPQLGDITWDSDDYVSKPIDKDLLLNKMNILMEKYFF